MNVTRQKFARRFLRALGAPSSRLRARGRRNRRALVAWQQAEGTTARYNPLATTLRVKGSTDFNSVGVQNYLTVGDGVNATVRTILGAQAEERGYTHIVRHLRAGDRAKETLDAVEDSAWGTGGLALRVLAGWRRRPDLYRAAARTPIGQ